MEVEAPILVTGFPRSGTSLVAGLIARAGVWTGKTIPGGPENPTGFFENVGLREGVSKQILSHLDYDRLGISHIPPLSDIRDSELEIRALVEAAIKMEGYKGGPWLFKDAKMTLLWPLWARAFPDAKWVIVRRAEDDIIGSCLRTGFMKQHSQDFRYWGERIDQYLYRLDELKKEGVWFREIWPHELIRHDEQASFKALFDDLGLEWQDPSGFVLKSAWHAPEEGETWAFSMTQNFLPKEEIYRNIRSAIGRGYPAVQKEMVHDRELVIVGGGPSVKDMEKIREIRKRKKKGAAVMALNGTHDFLLQAGIKPDYMCMLDARPDNVRFVERPRPGIQYIFASQLDPAVFDKIEEVAKDFKKGSKADIRLWHSAEEGVFDIVKAMEHPGPVIALGTTVGIKAICVAAVMGFRSFHLYGYDSCYKDGSHHAYPQTLNDDEATREIRCGGCGREFVAATWMTRQYEDFKNLAEQAGHMFRIDVHGDGLISHMIVCNEAQEAA